MELIIPSTKEHLFLTLAQFNDTDDAVLARCEIHKDQPFFMVDTKTYIAASSFRISAFGPYGYIYQYIKPEWFIRGVQQTLGPPSEPVSTDMQVINVRQGPPVDGDDHTRYLDISLQSTADAAGDSDADNVLLKWSEYLNPCVFDKERMFYYTADAYANGTPQHFRLLDSPAKYIQGQGANAQDFASRTEGLVDIQITQAEAIRNSDSPVYSLRDTHFLDCMAVSLIITDQEDIFEKLTDKDLKIYFSQGLYLSYDGSNAATDIPAQNTKHALFKPLDGAAVFEIVGPYPASTANQLDQHGLLKTPIWADDSEAFKVGSVVYYDTSDHGRQSTSIDVIGEDWFQRLGETTYAIQVVVRPTNVAAEAFANVQLQLSGGHLPHDEDSFIDLMQNIMGTGTTWNVSRSPDNILSSLIVKGVPCVSTTSPVVDWPDQASHLQQPAQIFRQEYRNSQQHIYEARTGIEGDKAVLTPNEMYEIFNIKVDDTGEGYPWILQTHSNGGFCIEFLRDLDAFEISQEFFDLLGLMPQVTRQAEIQDRSETNEQLVLVNATQDTDFGQHKPDFSLQGGLVSDIVVVPFRDTQEYLRESEEDSEQYDTPVTWDWATHHGKGRTIMQYGTGNFYIIVNAQKTDETQTIQRDSIYRGHLEHKHDGQSYYKFDGIQKGDRILNTSLVSVESFSLFEGLQITCPSLPFNPMITTFSSGMRVLCEIRLNFDYTGNSQQSGRVISTSDQMVSDIIWNASEHQYCQLTTGAMKLYNLVCQIELVYRDSSIPPKPIYIPPGGIFQVKCRIVTTE